jgi:hypothetical protein
MLTESWDSYGQRDNLRSVEPDAAKYELSAKVELIVKHGVTVNVSTCREKPRIIGTLAINSL